jgi:PAS domain S-box-containing protein
VSSADQGFPFDNQTAGDFLRHREWAQRVLVSIGDAIRSLHDPVEIIREITAQTGEHFRVSRCVYGETDERDEFITVTGQYVDGVQEVTGRHRLNGFGAPMIAELKRGRTIVIPDVRIDPRTRDVGTTFEAVETTALLCVPLIKVGRFVGLFVIAHREGRTWSGHEVALAERIAERVWFAVENARAEHALRESRDVLALAMRGGRMGAWSRDLRTGEVWWSRELEQIFNVPAPAFVGTESGFFALVHEDDRDAVGRAVAQAIDQHDDYLVEFRFKPDGGDWRWMEGRGRAVYAVDGTPLTLYGVGIDITERKAAEEALAAARDAAGADAARLSLALDAARLGDWSWDATTDVVTMSPRAAELFAIPPGPHMTWADMRDLLHQDDRERARLAIEESIALQRDYSIEYRLINGGRERWVLASGRPHYDRTGQVLGMFGVVQELSQSRLLVKLDDSMRALGDPEQITMTAARLLGEHLQVNRCAYATAETDQDQLLCTGTYTNGASAIVGRFTYMGFGDACRSDFRAGQPFVVGEREGDPRLDEATRASYRMIDLRAGIGVPILKSGRLVAAMGVHSKTPRLWSAAEVSLVQHVASRCWESIERARVERERATLLEAAESANRAKDEFLAMLGHELRNPLSPILTALQLMKLRGVGGAERERTVIERQVEHLTRLVDDLLDVSRIAGGKVDLKLEVIELSEVVARALEVASPLLEERQHVLDVAIPRRGLPIEGDAPRLSQIVTNLITNAAKYTPAGGRIKVTARGDGRDVVLSVKDNGIGIARDVLPRVFDLFVQGQQTLDRSAGGLGLGLAIVKNLVERHGGSVSASSEGPGHGSEFEVRLPKATTAPPAGDAHDTGPIPIVSPRDAVRILIVDDNEDAANLLADVLRLGGHDIRVAHDAAEALQIASTTLLDAAFLDIGLPVIDGYELAARLRQLPGFEEIKLVAITGYGQESDLRRSKAAGFDHHIVKPADIRVIEKLVIALRERRTPA